MEDRSVNLVLIVASILVVLVGLETVLAVGLVEDNERWQWDVSVGRHVCDPPDDYGEKSAHPEYGWTVQPDVVGYDRKSPVQDWERHETNAEGFKDVYDTGDQNAIVLGDSFTYGYISSNDETFPFYLDRWNDDVAFHNFGVPGYGPQQYYLVYEDRAEEIDHDLVIVGYYLGNDLTDIRKFENPMNPIFDVSNGELQQVREAGLRNNTADLDRPPESARYSVLTLLLEEVHRIAAENDAQVLVVTIPDEYSYKEQVDHLDEFAADRSDVHTLHTESALDGEQKSGNRVFGTYDIHLDDYGNYVVARTIQSWLVENDETGLEVATEPGDPPNQGLLARVSGKLRHHTESYGFLASRTRVLGYKAKQRFGLYSSGESLCD